MRFIGNYGNEVVVTPGPAPVRDSTLGTTWTARTEAHTLTLIAREAVCRDAMSGEVFSHTVTVRVDGTERRGCGRPLRTGERADHFTVADGHLKLYGNDRLLARFEVVYFR